MTFAVFFSHSMSSEDSGLVEELFGRLRERGIDPYLAERDLQPGQNLASKVVRRIRSSDLVAVFWTRKGAASEWVNQEVGAAHAAGKLVVPIVERGVQVKGVLEGIERVEFERDHPESAMEALELYMARQRDAKLRAQQEGELFDQNLVLAGIAIAVVVAFIVVLVAASRS